ncbi:MAG: hypothetical protein AAFZ63_17240 [Bacteroidota bacterium]
MNKQIQTLISQNKLSEAIKELRKLNISARSQRNIDLIESRFNEINEKIRIGIISEESSNIELNKIRNSLIEINSKLGTEQNLAKNSKSRLLLVVLGVVLILFFAFTVNYFIYGTEKCTDSKIAILVADFLNNADQNKSDAFSNNLVTKMDIDLSNNLYDVSPVGFQTREIRRYHDHIKEQYFDNSCDTSGIFVNGFFDKEDEIFNVYVTFSKLSMKVPELSSSNSISMNNPKGIDLSVREETDFLANLLLGILKLHAGNTYDALSGFFDLEMNDTEKIIENNKSLKATLAFYKGTCFAMRGDNERAKDQYDIVARNGSAELVEASIENEVIANEVTKRMNDDPILRERLNENKKEHSSFEENLRRLLNQLNTEVQKGVRKVKQLFK